MSIENFIRAMPKVELNVQLVGAIQRETLAMIAEQNDIAYTDESYDLWMERFDHPEYDRLEELVTAIGGWVRYSEDLTRIVYDLGVSFSKQNIRYAEVVVTPAYHMGHGLGFEQMMAGLEDGRDRVERGWDVRMGWILAIPRDNPRVGDDVARWATSAVAKKSNVVALGISGQEDTQPLGQFKRAFATAEKKGVWRVAHANTIPGIESIQETIEELDPSRLYNSWDINENAKLLSEKNIPVVISMIRELRLGRIETLGDYPIQELLDDEVPFSLGVDMPELYKSTLTDEYLALAEQDFTIEEIETMALNSVHHSFLPHEEKEALLANFAEQFQQLHEEYLVEETSADTEVSE